LRLRKKPWIATAIHEYSDIVIFSAEDSHAGHWRELFDREQPVHVELGTGKGDFLVGMAQRWPDINFIGIEYEAEVLYYAARKVREQQLTNIRLLPSDSKHLTTIFAPGEIHQLYINFCDPWPKRRHAKRRLTHPEFLDRYRIVLVKGGGLAFKTDNERLFEYSLNRFAANGLALANISLDLHHYGNVADNVMTEYEQKFCALGMKIYRCEAYFSDGVSRNNTLPHTLY
jgi:tRNA (guanine-N7-)-methyltransferase